MQTFQRLATLKSKGCVLIDKTSLDITWIKDKSLADLDNLPDPDELAEDIVENLEGALESFKAVIALVLVLKFTTEE